jgi:hypothetical protein
MIATIALLIGLAWGFIIGVVVQGRSQRTRN